MKLVLSGIVSTGDTYRAKKSVKKGFIYLNELDIVPIINEYFRNKPVLFTFLSGNYTFQYKGRCLVGIGYLDREYPMEPDFFNIEQEDILWLLKTFEGQCVTLIFETEGNIYEMGT